MSRSVGLAHVIRNADRTASGVWGTFALRTAFQPIMAFAGGKLRVAAFEGLARPSRDGRAVPPGVFFGLVPAADRLHVDTLLRTVHVLNAGAFLPRDALVFINFDPSLFTEREVAQAALREIRLVLHEAGVAPGRLVCEITEQRLPAGSSLLFFADALRSHGIKVAVDDYGAADSDMARIRAVKPDIVKFDAKWTARLMESGPGLGLLAAMAGEFAAQNIATVFEGIEHRWQLEAAERAGASMVQGYALARPELVLPRAAPPAGAPPEQEAASGQPGRAPATARAAVRPPRAFGRRSSTP